MKTLFYPTDFINSELNIQKSMTQGSSSQNYSPFSFRNFVKLSQNKQKLSNNLDVSVQSPGCQTSSYDAHQSFSQLTSSIQILSPIWKNSEVTANSYSPLSIQSSMLNQQNIFQQVPFIVPFYPIPIPIQSYNDKLVKKEENKISFKKYIPQSQNLIHQSQKMTLINQFKSTLEENKKAKPIYFKTTDELIKMKMGNKISKKNQTKQRLRQSESLSDVNTKTSCNELQRKQLTVNRHKKIEKKNIPTFSIRKYQQTTQNI